MEGTDKQLKTKRRTYHKILWKKNHEKNLFHDERKGDGSLHIAIATASPNTPTNKWRGH